MPTYYVKATPSGDELGGNEANAMSIVAAADAVIAGDTVYVKADGVYEIEDGVNDCVLLLSTTGTVGAPILWQGYAATINDGGIAQINADPAGDQFANCFKAFDGNILYQVFKNFEVKGASSNGISLAGADYWVLKNCNIHNNGGDGFSGDNGCMFENCTFNNNSGDGVQGDQALIAISCLFYTNTLWGIISQAGTYYNCAGYANGSGSYQFDSIASNIPSCVLGCTIDGENVDPGINFIGSGSVLTIVVNSIIYDTTLGIDTDENIGELAIARNNLYNNNATDVNAFLAVSAGNGIGNRGDVTGAPAFTDEGGDDYTLGGASPALNAALDSRFTTDFWDDYNNGAGNNPPSP